MKATGRPAGALGMFNPIRPASGTVLGADRAMESLLEALAQHGHRPIRLYAPPLATPGLRTLFRTKRFDRRLRVYPLAADGEGLQSNFFAWHDVAMDAQRPFYVRQEFGRSNFPVTLTHHALSYQALLHEFFLPLLLGDIRPHDAVVCTSRAAQAAFAALLDHVADRFNQSHGTRLRFRGQLAHIPLGVDTARFKPGAKGPARQSLGLAPDGLVLLWLGRFSTRDKADLLPLLRVFERLRRRHRNQKLILALAGTEVAFDLTVLESYAAVLGVHPAVRWFKGADALSLLQAADIFVSPVDNLQESFGLAPLEALACGVPQVGSDWNGYRDTIAHGETGFLVPTRWLRCGEDLERTSKLVMPHLGDHFALAQSVTVDTGALEKALNTLIDNPALRRRMAAASRRRARQLFDWRVVVRAYESLWARLSEESKAAAPASTRPPAYDTPAFFTCFRHYASEVLGEECRLRLSASGRAARAGSEPLPLYHVESLVRLASLRRILRHPGLGRPQGVPVKRLLGSARRARPAVARHVAWLFKQGFVELA